MADWSWLAGRASEVAPRLLGHTLWCGERWGTIVEVEAYEGLDDPASHAFRGPTGRSGIMFERHGLLYVYRIYGMHWCANVVCGPEGTGSALLLRALEPGGGIDQMWSDRPKARTETDLTSGPGKLCAALGIDGAHCGIDLLRADGPVHLGPAPGSSSSRRRRALPPIPAASVAVGPRVGISKAVERPWRFAIAGNAHVSRPRPPGWN